MKTLLPITLVAGSNLLQSLFLLQEGWVVSDKPKIVPGCIINALKSRKEFGKNNTFILNKKNAKISNNPIIYNPNKNYHDRRIFFYAKSDSFSVICYQHTVFSLHTHAVLFKNKNNDNCSFFKSIYFDRLNQNPSLNDVLLALEKTEDNKTINEY